jgi:hypothetical protein
LEALRTDFLLRERIIRLGDLEAFLTDFLLRERLRLGEAARLGDFERDTRERVAIFLYPEKNKKIFFYFFSIWNFNRKISYLFFSKNLNL